MTTSAPAPVTPPAAPAPDAVDPLVAAVTEFKAANGMLKEPPTESPEAAKQPIEGADKPTDEPSKPPESPPEQTPKARQLALGLRREAQQRQMRQQLEQERARINADKAAVEKAREEQAADAKLMREDPLAFAAKHDLSYDEINKKILSGYEPPKPETAESKAIREYEARLERLEKTLAERDATIAEREFQTRLQGAQQKVVGLVMAPDTKYPACQDYFATPAELLQNVMAVIDACRQRGRVVDDHEVLEYLENNLTAAHQRHVARTSKIVGQAPQKIAAPVMGAQDRNSPQTLTRSLSSDLGVARNHVRTDDERRADALAALETIEKSGAK